MIRCISCGCVMEDHEPYPSHRITAITMDPPEPICPGCRRASEFERVSECGHCEAWVGEDDDACPECGWWQCPECGEWVAPGGECDCG